jgi:predicted GNAT family acetyltransferase
MQRLVRYRTTAEFLRDVHDYLAVREAANSLILGLAIRLVGEPHAFGSTPPYFAAVFDEVGPAMVAMMTPPYNLILSAEGKVAGEGLELLARDLMQSELPVPGAQGPTGLAEQFAASWARLAGVTSRRGISLRLYELREVIPPRDSPGSLRVATEADMELVIAWMDAFHREAVPHEPPSPSGLTQRRIMAGDAFLWDDNGAVSMAFKSRPTQHGISVGPVYTPPEFRRRGYATSCVAALSQQLLDAGFQYCALFTDLSNPTSNDIYQQVGYRPVCDFQEIVFMPKGTHEPTTP